MKEQGTNIKNKNRYELKVGGAGCFASPCRLLRKNNIPKVDAEAQCNKVKFKDHSREYSCVFRKFNAKEQSYLSEAYGDHGSIGAGCFDTFMNGNKGLVNRKRLGTFFFFSSNTL